MEFYIVNDFDRPYQKHVCQRMNRKGQLEYISPELRNWHRKNGRMMINDESTLIQKFGFDVEVREGKAKFIKTRQSVAKYRDGKRREWQGEYEFSLEVK